MYASIIAGRRRRNDPEDYGILIRYYVFDGEEYTIHPLDDSLYSWKKEHTEIPDLTFPVNVFHIRFPDMLMIPPHWHEHMEWILVTKGSFQVQVGAQSKECCAGEVVWVNRNRIHAAYPADQGSELFAIVYNEAILRGGQDSAEARYIRPLLAEEIRLPAFYGKETQISGAIRSCLERVLQDFPRKGTAFELRVKGELFSALGQALQLAEQMPKPKQNGHSDKGIEQLLVHLGSHFREPITVEEASRMCCLTPTYFCFLFKKTTGKTLVEYLHILRVHEATHLLRLHRCSIQAVAEQTGFSSQTYFGRVFKEITGMTPSQYADRFPFTP
ncbi:AraC family transcriptional regulator [Paenibacillus sp. YN15]|uniref:helix-turn-helix domain-containing protein n=1 Tax=Paenibacillus sp. YN15 TaxID=1742774 RepID=UPI000DCE1138|nr:AraC family transcriptional regulator [Paenibacillus sp. YN15]RAV05524.1 hypothetical protein DQG13_02570 [Paenibacillus sp. YN15]